MDFGLSDEQRFLTETLGRFLEDQAPMTRVREIANDVTGHDSKLWRGFSELGMVGLLVDEEYGGVGLTLLDAALVSQALGAAAAPTPFLSCGILAPVIFAECGSHEQRRTVLPQIVKGEQCISVALNEIFSRREDVGVRVESGKLVGNTLFALDSGCADAFLVATEGHHLALIARSEPGLEIVDLPTIDLTRRVAELKLDSVVVSEWMYPSDEQLERVLAAGRVALAADLVGACERALGLALEYAKERRQFGRIIASFQAVKHMCAEMVAELELARSLVWYSAHAFSALPNEAVLSAAHAKAYISEVGRRLLNSATEVHGGIGFTAGYDLHWWWKRAALDRQLLGTPELLRRLAADLQRGASS